MQTRNILKKEDIDLIDKLENLSGSEISERVYSLSKEPKTFKKIEEKIWSMLGNSALPYHNAYFFEGMAKEYDAKDEHDMITACLYNCDLIYMQAIASILKLKMPRNSGDFLE